MWLPLVAILIRWILRLIRQADRLLLRQLLRWLRDRLLFSCGNIQQTQRILSADRGCLKLSSLLQKVCLVSRPWLAVTGINYTRNESRCLPFQRPSAGSFGNCFRTSSCVLLAGILQQWAGALENWLYLTCRGWMWLVNSGLCRSESPDFPYILPPPAGGLQLNLQGSLTLYGGMKAPGWPPGVQLASWQASFGYLIFLASQIALHIIVPGRRELGTRLENGQRLTYKFTGQFLISQMCVSSHNLDNPHRTVS